MEFAGSSSNTFTSWTATVIDSIPRMDNHQLSRRQMEILLAQLNEQAALQGQEQLVLGRMPMPGKLAVQFGEFSVMVIQGGDNTGLPMVKKGVQPLIEINDFQHGSSRWSAWIRGPQAVFGKCPRG